MPLWRIWHPANVWTQDDKDALAKAITKPYNDAGLPAFYVDVIYTELSGPDDMYVGGERNNNSFVRISIDQIAVDLTPRPIEKQNAWLDKLDAAIAPFIKERGLSWELHIDSTPRSLWRIQGTNPPEFGSGGETLWREQNKPVRLDHDN